MNLVGYQNMQNGWLTQHPKKSGFKNILENNCGWIRYKNNYLLVGNNKTLGGQQKTAQRPTKQPVGYPFWSLNFTMEKVGNLSTSTTNKKKQDDIDIIETLPIWRFGSLSWKPKANFDSYLRMNTTIDRFFGVWTEFRHIEWSWGTTTCNCVLKKQQNGPWSPLKCLTLCKEGHLVLYPVIGKLGFEAMSAIPIPLAQLAQDNCEGAISCQCWYFITKKSRTVSVQSAPTTPNKISEKLGLKEIFK